ncbi:hypothetical protein RJT34_14461 [Clitoria ternatea]|uniref:WDR36/Utp21 C-terminal domain-containing protein n=1 Tax=Clitoria ternatea TaxID=43366 RepID=A0AAN9JSP1_CLITE
MNVVWINDTWIMKIINWKRQLLAWKQEWVGDVMQLVQEHSQVEHSGEILFEFGKMSVAENNGTGDGKQMEAKSDLASSHFLYLLQCSKGTENYPAFTDYVKRFSPSTLEAELRMLQVIDDADDQQEAEKRPQLVPIEQLLDYFIHEIPCKNNPEFLQGFLQLFLKVRDNLNVGQYMVRRFGVIHVYKIRQ